MITCLYSRPFSKPQKDPEPIETVLKASNDAIAMWSKQYPSQVTINSPDNPLLGLSEAEYLAMK